MTSRTFDQGREPERIRTFYAESDIAAGDQLAIEQAGDGLLVYPWRTAARPAIRCCEFFAGIGLVRLALERAGGRVVLANDIDADKHKLYAQNFAADDFVLGDVHEMSAAEIPPADLWTASFPCNDLSLAGKLKGLAGEHSSAFWGVMRLLEAAADRPRLILFENVYGLLTSHQGSQLAAAVAALGQAGYACDVIAVNAVDFVPQSRLRLFVIAQRDAKAEYPWGLAESRLRPRRLTEFILRHPQLDWAVTEPPLPPTSSRRLEELLEELPDDHSAWWNQERTEYFMNQLSDRHAAEAAEMTASATPRHATAFRRVRQGRSMAELRTDGVAGCLRTPRGGSGRQILFRAGAGRQQVRLLTPRECARLQGVPDWYRLDVSASQALFGFGDAVCVPVVQWIAATTACSRS